jgi:hypothetical protein
VEVKLPAGSEVLEAARNGGKNGAHRLGFGARGEINRGRERAKEKENQRAALGLYPLARAVVEASITVPDRATARSPPSCLPPLRKTMAVEVGWACKWASAGRGRERVGPETAQSKGSYLFSFKSLFYFLFFQNPLLFHKKGLQIQNYL